SDLERARRVVRRPGLALARDVERAREVGVVALALQRVVEDEQVAGLEPVVARRAVREPDAVDAHERAAVVAEVDAEPELGGDLLHQVLHLAVAQAGAELGPQAHVELDAALHRAADAGQLLGGLAPPNGPEERLARLDARARHGLLDEAAGPEEVPVRDAVAQHVALAVVQVDGLGPQLPQPGREALGEGAVVVPDLVEDAEPLDVAPVVVGHQRQAAAPWVEHERRLAADAGVEDELDGGVAALAGHEEPQAALRDEREGLAGLLLSESGHRSSGPRGAERPAAAAARARSPRRPSAPPRTWHAGYVRRRRKSRN